MKKLIVFGLLILACVFLFNSKSAGKADPCQLSGSPFTLDTRTDNFKTGMNVSGQPGSVNKAALMAKAVSIAVPFVKNVGQFNDKVRFAADLFGGRFFLTDKELVYSLFKRSDKKRAQTDKHRRDAKSQEKVFGKGLVFREYFVDKKNAKIELNSSGEQQAETVVSYFKGNDASKWRSGVSSYQVVSLGEVYPGIEVKIKASGKNVEKIFFVSPQSNVADIKISVEGIAGLKIDKAGKLILKNSFGELAMRTPVAWQEIDGERHEVRVGYRLLENNFYSFVVMNEYDKKYSLIIDPDLDTLMASTYLGGSSDDCGNALVLDSAGNVFVTGNTKSTDFPTTIGAYDRTYNGVGYNIYSPGDIFISKLDSNLTMLLASTYLGGSAGDESESLTLDSAGNVYLTGGTASADFPTTPGAYDRIYTGEICNVFVAKLNNQLTTLIGSTYLGGSRWDEGLSLALDSAGNVYLTGVTYSRDFPITPGAYDQSGGGNYEIAFISKLNGNLTGLLASTYLGGSEGDEGRSLALDSAGHVYLTGYTESADFPTTAEAYERTYKVIDAFVSKLDSNLTTLLASTFLGGSGYDEVRSLALDSSGNVYVTGDTYSVDFPTTPGAYNRTRNGFDVFVSKLNNNLTTLLASTFLGGGWYDEGDFLVLDSSDTVYITGVTWSVDFPTTPGAYDRTYNGDNNHIGDVFVSRLDSNLTTLLASTFLGGHNHEKSYALALNNLGNVCVTGWTDSTDFPSTPGAYDRTYSGSYEDVFISKLDSNLITLLASTYLGGGLGSIGITVTSPKGGEIWLAGKVHYITWESTPNSIASVRIEVSIDNGSNWSDVIGFTANTGSYPWTIPNTPSSRCLVRISDNADAAISGTSKAVFSIMTNAPPQVVIVSPENNASVYGVVTIKANVTDDMNIARVEFYVDGVLKGQAATLPIASKQIHHALGTSGNSKIAKKTLLDSSDQNPEVKGSRGNSQYIFTWNTTDASLGVHILRVVAYNEAGTMGFAEITVQVLKVNLDLLAERHEIKAFSIKRQYGLIQFTVETFGIPVAQYRLFRCQGNGDFVMIKAIIPSELQNNQFQMQDKYLEKNTPYTYRVEAYNASEQLIGKSLEKTI
jgi:hypothetical protein